MAALTAAGWTRDKLPDGVTQVAIAQQPCQVCSAGQFDSEMIVDDDFTDIVRSLADPRLITFDVGAERPRSDRIIGRGQTHPVPAGGPPVSTSRSGSARPARTLTSATRRSIRWKKSRPCFGVTPAT